MSKKLTREWKKVLKTDLPYIVYEIKDIVKVPAMIILEGPLGAGKTTFTQVFLGEENILSPTYSVLSESKLALHADFYRIEKNEEIMHLELPLYLEDKQYFLVEWGEKFFKRLAKEVPETFSFYQVEIEVIGENQLRHFKLFTLSEE